MSRSDDFLFDEPLASLDPSVHGLVESERIRQEGKLILIASESLCPRPVAEALTSPFSAIYAEGYPSSRMMHWERDRVEERDRHLAFNRRYSDRRYYKGCEYVNFIEVIAQKRAAELFAANGVRPDDIFANVQPLSGSAANNAIYTAFVEPGDLVMGMALPHGGHLTHGSHLNRSGKFYRIIPYTVDAETGRLDYDAIKDAVQRHRPRLLIAGASAYPWQFDWQALKEAASRVPGRGCLLLADISHPAGLVAAGEFSSPVGYADVISMTTHKTLCGPRGAIILSTDRLRAAAIDQGVFPGEQGGPHIHQIAAKAVAFRIARTDRFKRLMGRIRKNADTFASALKGLGMKVQGGGTASHLLLLDLKGSKKPSGVPLYGDICSNLLDLCNITVNKNTIIGDASAAHPTGIRIGTTVVSQQGYGPEDMATLAGLIHRLVEAAETFTVTTGGGVRGRARIDLDAMEEVRRGVRELTGALPPDSVELEGEVAGESSAIEVRGERAGVFLQGLATCDVLGAPAGESVQGALLDKDGRVLAEVAVKACGESRDAFEVCVHPSGIGLVERWLRGVSDGYLKIDGDPARKVDGPVAIRRIRGPRPEAASLAPPAASPSERPAAIEHRKRSPHRYDPSKVWCAGGAAVLAETPAGSAPSPFVFNPDSRKDLKKTSLHPVHAASTAAHNLVPFAGWEMPVLYTSILEEHQRVRKAGGLFDLAHMGTMEVRGPGATRFLDLLTTNFVWRLRPGISQYTYILKPSGDVMDDLLIYMLAPERYLVVANAVNADEVLQWFRAVAAGDAPLSVERPGIRMDARPRILDLKDRGEAGDAMRVDLGFQGPRTRDALLRLADSSPEAARTIAALEKGEQAEVRLRRFDIIASRTGYTGEETGYEIFVHPDQAPDLWRELLEAGSDLGIGPAGLGARDSLRAEAGFPLYGHELAGEHRILPSEAGYAAFVKEHKPFFAGRDPHLAAARTSKRAIVRMRFEHTGIRMLQPGDPVANPKGAVVGVLTSTVLPGERQLALALVDRASARPGTRLAAFLRPRRPASGGGKAVHQLGIGDQIPVPEPAVVLERFPRHCGEDSCGNAG